jgi:hypothetical protein
MKTLRRNSAARSGVEEITAVSVDGTMWLARNARP